MLTGALALTDDDIIVLDGRGGAVVVWVVSAGPVDELVALSLEPS